MKRVIVALLALCVTACGSIPTPELLESARAAAGEPALLAPAVNEPLDAAKFVASPCTSIPEERLQRWKPKEPGIANTGKNPSCDWTLGAPDGLALNVIYFTSIPLGLSQLYELRTERPENVAYFEETSVSTHPALFYAPEDERPQGRCGVNVGLTDQLFVMVIADSPTSGTGCDYASDFATLVVETIRNAQ